MSSRKRNAYLMTIGVCGVAVAVDRLLLDGGTPKSASAIVPAQPTSDPDVKKGISSPPTAPGKLTVPEIPFPRMAAGLTAPEEIRDFLTRPSARTRDDAETTAHKLAGQKEKAALTTDNFASRHRLTGILASDQQKIAIINDRFISMGTELDGCVLREISQTNVVFQCADGHAVLKLPEHSSTP